MPMQQSVLWQLRLIQSSVLKDSEAEGWHHHHHHHLHSFDVEVAAPNITIWASVLFIHKLGFNV